MTSGPERVGDVGEFELIDRIRAIVGASSALAGIGDDAAVIDLGGPDAILATVDMQVQDVHFRLADWPPADLGRRVVAVNLSDIAAMGGTPRHLLSSLALPPDTAASWVEQIYRGMAAEAKLWGTDIVGGNLTRIGGPICIDAIILGSVPRDQVILRSGGQPGDLLAVTGPLGTGAAWRLARDRGPDLAATVGPDWSARARRVHPRLREGRALATAHLAHAMLDLSDGLAGDVAHLCAASAVGAEIDVRRLPIEPEVRAIAGALDLDPVTLALTGGEDYELLVALSRDDLDRARVDAPAVMLHPVGRLVPFEGGVTMLDEAGKREPLPARAWRHF